MSNARFRDWVKQGSLGLCEFHNVKFQLFIITSCELADFVGGALHPASLSRYARGAICARSLTSKLADSLRLIIIQQRSGFIIHHFFRAPLRSPRALARVILERTRRISCDALR